MKQLLCIVVLVLSLSACKKEKAELIPQSLHDQSADANLSPTPVEYVWTALTAPAGAPGDLNIIMPVNGMVFCKTGTLHNNATYKLNNTTKRWELFTDFQIIGPGSKFLFSYQSKIYAGLTDAGASASFNNFYSVDPTTGVSTGLAEFPGTHVAGFLSFVVGDKGYLLGGINVNSVGINQYWEYNFATNQWTDKGSSPLGARFGATSMVIDDKAYIGLGAEYIYLNGQKIKLYKNDWIQFNPASLYHAIKASFPGTKRAAADGFVLNSSAYVGFGVNNDTYFTDFWKYNPSSNTWMQQASWPGTFGTDNTNIGAFSMGNAGYVVKGGLDQFWRFSTSSIVGPN